MDSTTRKKPTVRGKTVAAALVLAGLAFGAGVAHAGQGAAQEWRYTPDVGLEGLASASNGKDVRVEVECGNGGGPSITLFSPAVTESLLAGKKETLRMDLIVDDTVFTEPYSCYPGQKFCTSEGFPSHALIEAMRQGSQLEVRLDGTDLAGFSLKGSDAAIAPLSFCLGPDAY